MTVSPQPVDGSVDNGYRRNIRAADLRTNDLHPVCPRCHEINSSHSVVCVECGVILGMPLTPLTSPAPWSTSA